MSEIVMVGVDGSNTAFKAASRAADIAEGLNAELAVLSAHVRESTEVDAKQAQKMAELVASKLREEHPDLSISPVAVRGKPQEALVEEAARVGAGLLVVGNVGSKGLGRVLGSVANSVARNAPCDVLIVKTDR
ncbi:MAG: universal stress protein [Actinomycetota bacterium]